MQRSVTSSSSLLPYFSSIFFFFSCIPTYPLRVTTFIGFQFILSVFFVLMSSLFSYIPFFLNKRYHTIDILLHLAFSTYWYSLEITPYKFMRSSSLFLPSDIAFDRHSVFSVLRAPEPYIQLPTGHLYLSTPQTFQAQHLKQQRISLLCSILFFSLNLSITLASTQLILQNGLDIISPMAQPVSGHLLFLIM